jgi:uncharacterized delta-60 repeat protein
VRCLAFALLLLLTAGGTALAAPGDLDSSFDGDGVRILDLGGVDAAAGLVIQPDGRIVATGIAGASVTTSDNFGLARLKLDGSLDTSFSDDGKANLSVGGKDRGGAAALQPDGKIVVVGDTIGTATSDFGVLRSTADGVFDPTFDDDGTATIDFGGVDWGDDVLVQPDGKIVLAGSVFSDVAVVRLNPDGSVEGGARRANFGALFGRASAAALQPDGKIVVAGYTVNAVSSDFAVARYNADLTLDSSFDGDGRKTFDYGADDMAGDVLIQPDGKIVLTGTGYSTGDVAVTRLNRDGSLDSSFDGDGSARVDLGDDKADIGLAAALQANGKIVVAGTGGASQVVLLRFQPGGALDTTFDGDGKQTLPVTGGASAVVLLPDGRIVAAGSSEGNFLLAMVEGDSAAAGGGPGTGPGGGGPGGGKSKVPRCAGKKATIVGTNKPNRLKGTRRADVIVALGGNDRIDGGRGNDLVCAGDGNDSVKGSTGNDRLYGQNGKDNLDGGAGRDALSGGAGKDGLSGGSDRDQLSGGGGKDRCNGGGGKDRAACERRREI